MKKAILIFFVFVLGGFTLNAQTIAPAPVAQNNPNAPVITFNENLFDYGTIAQDGDGIHLFIYKNTGKEPLVLSKVRSSCGCTIPEWSREPLLSGKQDTLKVSYDTHRIGRFNKTISIFSNASKAMEVVRIQGEVVAKATAN